MKESILKSRKPFRQTLEMDSRSKTEPLFPRQLTLDDLTRFQLERARRPSQFLLEHESDDPEQIMKLLQESNRKLSGYSLLRTGMLMCSMATSAAQIQKNQKVIRAAVRFADALLVKHQSPQGGFIEWDWNSWLDPSVLWRTIPWGVGACGNRVLEAWRTMKEEFSPEQRQHWQRSLEKIGAWIYRNPVVGGYVFNMGIDLCSVLWRIGNEFNQSEWCRWALETAEHRIQRDIDDEGWIQAEDGGSSGNYQLIGVKNLAWFSWETKAPFLKEAFLKIFRNSSLPYSTETMQWPGNYGTRSSCIDPVPTMVYLVATAYGETQAAYFVRKYARELLDPPVGYSFGTHHWELWKGALKASGTVPTYSAVTNFRGISATVIREGPWIAYFGNYDRSIWTRGFNNLWHSGHGDWVFSTLHSLPKLPESVRAKMQIDETRDWAGFPHVTVKDGNIDYHSHRKIESLETSQGEDGVRVEWSEPLLDVEGKAGGTMHSDFRFHGAEIEIKVALDGIHGDVQIDFHFMRRPKGFARLWMGKEVEDIFAGRLLKTAGGYEDGVLKPGEPRLYAVQLDRTVFGFQVLEAPETAVITLVGETPKGLHTGNHGGFRFRIAIPETEKKGCVHLKLKSSY